MNPLFNCYDNPMMQPTCTFQILMTVRLTPARTMAHVQTITVTMSVIASLDGLDMHVMTVSVYHQKKCEYSACMTSKNTTKGTQTVYCVMGLSIVARSSYI